MKNIYKYLLIIIILLFIVGGSYFLFFNNNKITIAFNTNMETTLQNIEIKKGDSIELPVLERDGYTFLGWYINDTKVDCNYKFEKSSVLTAKWRQGISSGQEILDFKPVLYLYPEKKKNVKVSFEHPKYLTTTYPKYLGKWEVTAYPDGSLYDKDGKYYYGLYWEGENINPNLNDFQEGFYVEKDDALKFLDEKLDKIGLTRREANEFITYWLPILEKNEKNLVYFELTEERESYNHLYIEPKPDSLLRMFMKVKKVDKKVNIKEQKLEIFERKGFVAVEWGGTNLK